MIKTEHGREISGLELRHSIIRRSAGVTAAYLAGHAFSYALVFGANRILDSGGFGLFYASLLTITVLMSPMTALMFVLGRRIATENATGGQAQAATIAWGLLNLCLKWGAPAAVLLGVILALAGPRIGIEAWQILLLTPVTVLALVTAEFLRMSLQSMLLFKRASMLWIASQITQVALSFLFLLLFQRVWTGILGVAIGAASVSAVFAISFACIARAASAPIPPLAIRKLVSDAPIIIAYSLFMLFSNIDILIGYWLLARAELDVYAASALLPKAVVTATFAVAQVVLPVVVEQRIDGHSSRFSVVKAIIVVTGMSVAAALVLWIAIPSLQTTPFAIRGLDFSVMIVLATASIGLSAMRILVVVEGAMQRYAAGLAQSGAVVLFMVLSMNAEAQAHRVAELYTIVVWGFLIMATAIFFPARRVLVGLNPFARGMRRTEQ